MMSNETTISEFRPAFDMPATPMQAIAMLRKWGDPGCATFDFKKSARAAEIFADALIERGASAIVSAVLAELERAVAQFPTWPTDPLHAVAVLGEEFGELTKAVLQSVYEPHKSGPGDVRSEAIQTAAMAIRFLQSLDAYKYARGAQHQQASTPTA